MKLYFGGVAIIPIILVLLPSNFFDDGDSVCLSVLLFDTECYGCGMTRGVQHLLHLEFSEAVLFNKLSVIVLPLLIYLWAQELLRIYKKLKIKV